MLETDDIGVLRDFNILCDRVREAKRMDIAANIVVKKERVCKIIDVAISGGCINNKI